MKENSYKEIFLAGGCFWGLEKYIKQIPGVIDTNVGYANGNSKVLCPTYEEVCYNNTGYAETVHVIYDNSIIELEELLTLFFDVIDPTSVNKQGNDEGDQYRTGIYFNNIEDEYVIKECIDKLQEKYEVPIVIQVEKLESYYIAESYHQNYLDKHVNGYCHIPKSKIDEVKEAYNRIKKVKKRV